MPETALTGDDHARDDDPSLTLGRYRLGRSLGRGAFGTVYEAQDQRLDRAVAIKVIPRELIATARFEHEAKAAARLAHPGIVALYEAAIDDDGAYLVSELVRGRTFGRLLADGECSDRQILEIGVALCDALDHAHREGVIHRDIKPSNVLVPRRPASSADIAKLTDFGVAHLPGSETLTQVGDVVGTAAYMAPEQAAGRAVSAEADLYSLALMLYEALSGVNPVADRLRAGQPRNYLPPLRRQRRDLDRRLAVAIDRALAPKLADRGSVGHLRAALVQALPGASEVQGVVGDAASPAELTVTRLRGRSAPHAADRTSAVTRHDRTPAERTLAAEHALTVRTPVEHAPTAAEPQATPRRRPIDSAAGTGYELPPWAPRGANALAAGLAGGWLAAHLLTSAPLAPLTIGLIVTGLCLLFPRLGWFMTVATLTGIAIDQGHAAVGVVLLFVTAVPALALLATGQGAALPAFAPALGMAGLAGAWPALASFTGRSWWQRAVVAAAGYIWVVLAGLLIGRDLYWQPLAAYATAGWQSSFTITWHAVLMGLASAPGIAGALLWAVIATVLPLTRSRRWPALELVAALLAAVLSVLALAPLGAQHVHDALLGGLAAALVAGTPALWSLARRRRARFESSVAVS